MFSGYFQGIITTDDFLANRGRYVAAKWQGPVAQSINPEKDAGAATARMKGGLSSPQMECAKVNVNWRDVLNDVAEFYSAAEEKGIPAEYVNNVFSVDTKDVTEPPEAEVSEAETPDETPKTTSKKMAVANAEVE